MKVQIRNLRKSKVNQSFGGSDYTVPGGSSFILCKKFSNFDPHGRIHPLDFIKEFDDLLSGWREKEKMSFVRVFMKGDSYGWAVEVAGKCTYWEQYKKFFLEKYWSKEEQQNILSEFWDGKKYDNRRSMIKGFCQYWINKHKELEKDLCGVIITYWDRKTNCIRK